jgi:hydroxymethylbilane synthase
VTLTIASRGSQLALWQARWVQGRLAELGYESRIEIIKTTGDKITDVPLANVGTKGLFTKEIEEALQDGRADLAVHSLKDLPTQLPAGLTLAATPAREDARDAMVGRRLEQLPAGAKVGTSSLRRAAQLKRLRPDLIVESIRGNLDTRLRKLEEGHYDAILLACAGLKRMGWADRIAEILEPEVMCPAAGQGALAVETREGGEGPVTQMEDPATRIAVTAERVVLDELGGGCQVPIGAHARVEGGRVVLMAVIVAPGGTQFVRAEEQGSAAEAAALGREVAARLLAGGGREILETVYAAPARDPGV